jgi:hypothetical protein
MRERERAKERFLRLQLVIKAMPQNSMARESKEETDGYSTTSLLPPSLIQTDVILWII